MNEFRRIGIMATSLAGLTALAGCTPPDSGNNSMMPPENTMVMNNSSAEVLPTNALDLASSAVFSDNPTFDNKYGHYSFSGAKLINTSFGPVLVAEGTALDAAHVTPGIIGAFYLEQDGTDFNVKHRYPDAVEAGGNGQVGGWSVHQDMGPNPIIITQGGFTAQGYTCGHTILTELTPNGPKERLDFVDTVDTKGALGDVGSATMGNITKADANGFTVKFTGSRNFTAHYTRKGNKYVLDGGDANKLAGCE